jgi:hypothetical protein
MVSVVRLTRHLIAGYGCREAEYRCGDLVLAASAEATEWCLRGWAAPAEIGEEAGRPMVAPLAVRPLVECSPCEALVSSF